MKKKKILLSASFLAVVAVAPVTAQLSVVTDPGLTAIQNSALMQQYTDFMTAVDTLYNGFDTTRNIITTIEQNYKRIQQATERMRSIDWENVQWDGDWDIRDDLYSFNTRVNRTLDQARKIEQNLYNPNITIGTKRYSLADLCGAGAQGKDIASAFKDYYDFWNDEDGIFNSIGKAMEGNLTEKQRRAIARKYGISARNYCFVVRAENDVRDIVSKAINAVQDETKKMKLETNSKRTAAIRQAKNETRDSDGNVTEAALIEETNMMIDLTNEKLDEMREAAEQTTALLAAQEMRNAAEKEAASEEVRKAAEWFETQRRRPSDSFILTPNSN